ncbi:MAG: metallophosphoesterase [Dehalococcoidia bacterium]|nr:metallophosphoesterase [Dehalococcoidia bacterium]
MRAVIVSDIHSNLAALQAVLEDAAREGYDELWCLGDLVGYGPLPNQCVALMQTKAARCLAGNHDLGVLGAVPLDDFNVHAAAANRWTAGVLEEEARAYLSSLASRQDFDGVTLAHGSPRDPVWEYVVSPYIAAASFAAFAGNVCFLGHSHLPLLCCEPPHGTPLRLLAGQAGRRVPLTGRCIVNPGSVGQPRDGDPRAAYAIYEDAPASAIEFRRVAYDVAATQTLMRQASLPAYLIERLAQGR